MIKKKKEHKEVYFSFSIWIKNEKKEELIKQNLFINYFKLKTHKFPFIIFCELRQKLTS